MGGLYLLIFLFAWGMSNVVSWTAEEFSNLLSVYNVSIIDRLPYVSPVILQCINSE